ncbi:U-box domain-containing protein 33-like isoform X2 [Silene latifolia]
MGSRGEITGKPGNEVIVDDKIYVAVGKEVKESKSALIWALHNSKGKKICILYVHVPAKMIPMPMGGKFPASKVGEKELKAFREKEQQEMLSILDAYLKICAQVGVLAEKIHIEVDSTIEEGIVELISQQRIGKLVMGAAADRTYKRKIVEPKSRKAIYVRNHAPDYCHIWFVCKGYLIYTREAVKQPILHIEEKPSSALDNNQPDARSLSHDLVSKLRFSDFDEDEGSSVEFGRSSRVSFSQSSALDYNHPDARSLSQDLVSRFRFSDFDRDEGTSVGFGQSSRVSFSQSSACSVESESVFNSPCRSLARDDARETDSVLLALHQSQDKLLGSSPPSVLESSINDNLYNQLEHAMLDAENSRRVAFEESMRRQKAEKEALNSIRKAETAERLFYTEVKLRKALEEELAKGKEELENMKNHWIKVSHELHQKVDQKFSLEKLIEQSKHSMEELEEKLFSAVELLQKYKNEHEKLQIERDNALREAEKLSKQLDQGPSDSHVPVFFSVFPFSDLEKATNYFDPSLKIGEGGYGSIYKGILRHTEVAIKILSAKSMQGPREFTQEVDALSKLRHPNLVTLVGACPESWALVYEYLPGGSLEDRLICKDNAPPLPWQTRIRIATELCSALIFLHSSGPGCCIHGDLKPSNVLLDGNCVCKLSDFGMCHLVSSGETSVDHTALFFTTQPKGTFAYMDPEFLSTGELSPQSDVYSFGIILLCLLTGKSALGIAKEVKCALSDGTLKRMLDSSAGDWPFVQAEQLAHLALRCCDMNRKNRPDLESDVWRVLEPMKVSCQSSSIVRLASDNQTPNYFICPIFQEIMEDPHIASDGFTYEAEAIRGWLDSGHDSSPMTNVTLENHNLTPNRALRSAIQEWLQHNRNR